MTQTRIVVNPRVKPVAEDLMETTGIDSLSNLFSILVTRYGAHLKATWALPLNESPVNKLPDVYHQNVVVNHRAKQSEDPAIARIASLIENF